MLGHQSFNVLLKRLHPQIYVNWNTLCMVKKELENYSFNITLTFLPSPTKSSKLTIFDNYFVIKTESVIVRRVYVEKNSHKMWGTIITANNDGLWGAFAFLKNSGKFSTTKFPLCIKLFWLNLRGNSRSISINLFRVFLLV